MQTRRKALPLTTVAGTVQLGDTMLLLAITFLAIIYPALKIAITIHYFVRG